MHNRYEMQRSVSWFAHNSPLVSGLRNKRSRPAVAMLVSAPRNINFLRFH